MGIGFAFIAVEFKLAAGLFLYQVTLDLWFGSVVWELEPGFCRG